MTVKRNFIRVSEVLSKNFIGKLHMEKILLLMVEMETQTNMIMEKK